MPLGSDFSVLSVPDSDHSQMDGARNAVLVFEVELGHQHAGCSGETRVSAGVSQVLLGGGIEEVLHHESLDDFVLLPRSSSELHGKLGIKRVPSR